jgi:hypothetical protein
MAAELGSPASVTVGPDGTGLFRLLVAAGQEWP